MTSTPTESRAAEAATTAKDEAAQVASSTANAAGEVAGAAKQQAANVVGEAVTQTQHLIGQATDQLNAQAGEQTQRLSGNLRELAQHFSQMAGAGEQGSTAQSLVQTAAQRAQRAAWYLEGKQPGDLVADLQKLGSRRPGAFLLGAAIAGAAVGRLVGGAKRATNTQQDAARPPTLPAEPYPGSTPGAATL